jgi:hypothetical protein
MHQIDAETLVNNAKQMDELTALSNRSKAFALNRSHDFDNMNGASQVSETDARSYDLCESSGETVGTVEATREPTDGTNCPLPAVTYAAIIASPESLKTPSPKSSPPPAASPRTPPLECRSQQQLSNLMQSPDCSALAEDRKRSSESAIRAMEKERERRVDLDSKARELAKREEEEERAHRSKFAQQVMEEERFRRIQEISRANALNDLERSRRQKWASNQLVLEQHSQFENHIWEIQKRLTKNIRNFNKVMSARMDIHRFTQIAVFLEVRRMIWCVSPTAHVRLFGSCTTELALPYSDIDIVIQLKPAQPGLADIACANASRASPSTRSPSMDSINVPVNAVGPASLTSGNRNGGHSRARSGSWSVSSNAGAYNDAGDGNLSLSARSYAADSRTTSRSHGVPSIDLSSVKAPQPEELSRQMVIEGLYTLSSALFEQQWAQNVNPIPTALIPVVKLSVRSDLILDSPDMRAAVLAIRPYQDSDPSLVSLPHLSIGGGVVAPSAASMSTTASSTPSMPGTFATDGFVTTTMIMTPYGPQPFLHQQAPFPMGSLGQVGPVGFIDGNGMFVCGPHAPFQPVTFVSPLQAGQAHSTPHSASSIGSGHKFFPSSGSVMSDSHNEYTPRLNRLRSPSIESVTNSTASSVANTPTSSTPSQQILQLSHEKLCEESSPQPPVIPHQSVNRISISSANSTNSLGSYNSVDSGNMLTSVSYTGFPNIEYSLVDPHALNPHGLMPQSHMPPACFISANNHSNLSSPPSSARTPSTSISSVSTHATSHMSTSMNPFMSAALVPGVGIMPLTNVHTAVFHHAKGVTIPVDVTIEAGEHRGIPTCDFIRAKLEKSFVLKPVIKVR